VHAIATSISPVPAAGSRAEAVATARRLRYL